MKDVTELRAELEEVAGPLAERLSEVEQVIAERESELSDLREYRRQLTSVVRMLNPELAPASKKKSKSNGTGDVAEETVMKLRSWVLANRDEINARPDGVYASGLLEDPDFTVIRNQSTLGRALKVLHEQGTIVLHSVGTGGRKNYKVV